MAMSGGSDDGEPMMEMNVTPLIDVMLVLLIMLILSVPPATHAVNIDLPVPSQTPPTNIDPIKNKIVISPDNQILWNGGAISEGQLVTNLEATKGINPEPELQYQPDAQASYDLSVKVLNVIKQSGVSKFGFVGNEQYREFNKAPGA
ncbi:MAG: ExbD/TolR family protein [Tsuneonella sp.]